MQGNRISVEPSAAPYVASRRRCAVTFASEKMDWNRTLSGTLALAYVGGAYFAGDAATAMKVAAGLVLPMACIWFGDDLGTYVGVMRGQAITTKTPGCLVRFGGWLIMLLPLVVGAVMFIRRK